jgi:hypothetical protein
MITKVDIEAKLWNEESTPSGRILFHWICRRHEYNSHGIEIGYDQYSGSSQVFGTAFAEMLDSMKAWDAV